MEMIVFEAGILNLFLLRNAVFTNLFLVRGTLVLIASCILRTTVVKKVSDVTQFLTSSHFLVRWLKTSGSQLLVVGDPPN